MLVAWAVGETTVALVFQTGITWGGIKYIMLGLFTRVGVAIECCLLLTPCFSSKTTSTHFFHAKKDGKREQHRFKQADQADSVWNQRNYLLNLSRNLNLHMSAQKGHDNGIRIVFGL